ncbi:MAG: CBS domain-containing protein [Kangiellaceae bacterium]|jgi:predicted transcriptional regulator
MVNKIIKARDVMRTQFVEIEGVATVADAINAFKDNEIEVLVVKKRDEHDAYGVVLLSDIVKKVLAKNRAVNRVNIYEIMSKPIISIEPEMNIRYCARLFDNFGLSHTVVVEGGKVLGIVGYKEILVPWFEMDN